VSEPFLGQISVVSFGFAPRGWALCNGQLLPINQNQALFSLLGTTFGGDGRVTFALPNLQGRVPVHTGNGVVLGEAAGEASHTLTLAELPTHEHLRGSINQATSRVPAGNVLAAKPRGGVARYTGAGAPQQINDNAPAVGGGLPHENLQPYLTMNFVIALQGIFPSQN
jgi:microcystin-dependent protein